jgi:hypothetical protein
MPVSTTVVRVTDGSTVFTRFLVTTKGGSSAAIERLKHRIRKLNCYEEFVRQRIEQCPECSAAQVEDWLKEHYEDFPVISSRTVYSFVQYVRKKHHIPKPELSIRCEWKITFPTFSQIRIPTFRHRKFQG